MIDRFSSNLQSHGYALQDSMKTAFQQTTASITACRQSSLSEGVKFVSNKVSIVGEKLSHIKSQTSFDVKFTNAQKQKGLNIENDTSTKFKSNIPLDVVKGPKGEKTLFFKVDTEQRRNLDKEKFRDIQDHLKKLNGKLNTETSLEIGDQKGCIKDKEEAMVAEVLSKALAYLDPEMLRGETIEIPIKGEMIPYKIEVEYAKNLPYLKLTPKFQSEDAPKSKNLPTWVVIRGTDPNIIGKSAQGKALQSALDSVSADFAKGKIDTEPGEKIARDLKTIEGQVNIVGHSLGAYLAQVAAVEVKDTDVGAKVDVKAYAFNSPCVFKETKDKYEELAKKERQPEVIAFCKAGDPVSGAGRFFLGKQAFRISQGNSRADLAHREIDLHLNHTIAEIDIKAEEGKGARRLMEGVRQHIGGPVSDFVISRLRENEP